jgi:hypothetical protein
MRHLAAALSADRKKEANELNTRSTAIFRRASQDPVSVCRSKRRINQNNHLIPPTAQAFGVWKPSSK